MSRRDTAGVRPPAGDPGQRATLDNSSPTIREGPPCFVAPVDPSL